MAVTSYSSNRSASSYCNVINRCTTVCPEDITITDTAIIPLKEPVVDQAYNPLGRLIRTFTGAA